MDDIFVDLWAILFILILIFIVGGTVYFINNSNDQEIVDNSTQNLNISDDYIKVVSDPDYKLNFDVSRTIKIYPNNTFCIFKPHFETCHDIKDFSKYSHLKYDLNADYVVIFEDYIGNKTAYIINENKSKNPLILTRGLNHGKENFFDNLFD